MGAKKKNAADGANTYITVVLKVVDIHCDGCASKITRHLRSLQGVETAKTESHTGKVTVRGKVDPTELKDNLAMKIKKKVELISPQPNKEKENNDNKSENKKKKTHDDEKPKDKEAAVTTAVLKVVLHCQGCLDKIGKTVSKTKGVQDMSIDKEKETVTVNGTMDAKALAENLMEKLKRKVEVVSPKKESDEKEGGGKKKNKEGGGGGDHDNNHHKEEGEQSRMEYYNLVQPPYGYGYGNVGGYSNNYGPVYHEQFHAQPPQMFSDENPNACSVM